MRRDFFWGRCEASRCCQIAEERTPRRPHPLHVMIAICAPPSVGLNMPGSVQRNRKLLFRSTNEGLP